MTSAALHALFFVSGLLMPGDGRARVDLAHAAALVPNESGWRIDDARCKSGRVAAD